PLYRASRVFFFFDAAPRPVLYTLSLHDALPICPTVVIVFDAVQDMITIVTPVRGEAGIAAAAAFNRATERLSAIVDALGGTIERDRKSTRLNSSHVEISYAVFCLKKKKRNERLK